MHPRNIPIRKLKSTIKHVENQLKVVRARTFWLVPSTTADASTTAAVAAADATATAAADDAVAAATAADKELSLNHIIWTSSLDLGRQSSQKVYSKDWHTTYT